MTVSSRHSVVRMIAARRGLDRARRRSRRRALPIWAMSLLGLATFLAMAGTVAVGALFATWSHYADGYVPIEQKIAERTIGITEVYDRSGILLGRLPNPYGQLQEPVPLESISPWMIAATISTEDNDFWNHQGVNVRGLARAAWENYRGGVGSGTGGSSITQQLVKNVYLSDDCTIIDGQRVCVAPRTVDRKLREIAYAIQLEEDYNKDQILSWYLNQISYADRYVGVEAAARGYFHKKAADLTLAEAALLAGIPAAPTEYHPRLNCSRDAEGVCALNEDGTYTVSAAAKERQETVLRLMVEHGHITQEQADAAVKEHLKVYPYEGDQLAPAWIDNQVQPRLVRMCEAGLLPKIKGARDCTESVHNAGYKVTTTLSWEETSRATDMMRTAIANGLEANCNCHNAAIVTIDPPTGEIIVYAPNIDKNNTADRKVAGEIDQANEINQPGSSFKPVVYLTWFEALHKTPMSSLWDTSPMNLNNNDRIKDADDEVTITNPRPGGGGEGLITARLALGSSQNVPAFRAAQEAGVPRVIEMAKRMGITTLELGFDPTFQNHDAVYYGPSIATGGANIRLVDMAYVDSVIANIGVMVGVPTYARTFDPRSVKSLTAVEGEEYEETYQQYLDFTRGNIRLPGTRELDPVTILRVESIDGQLLYEHTQDVTTKTVVDPPFVWMLHSIMSDCEARAIIWSCGRSNDDLALDFFMPNGGPKIPGGVKTGTQQGFTSANDTLETWMTGYSRYAATALWVGNADNQNVNDGPRYGYAAANTTVRLFKRWMGQYHLDLQLAGRFETPADFTELQPATVVYKDFLSATTERGRRGGCNQVVKTWQHTLIQYKGDCNGGRTVPLPTFKPELAAQVARQRGIPISGFAGGQFNVAPTPTASPEGQQPTPTPPTATPPRQQATPTPVQPTPPPPTPTPVRTQPPQPTPVPTQASSGSQPGGQGGGGNPGSGGPPPGQQR